MATTQCLRVTALLLLGLVSLASPAAINLATSLAGNDDLNQIKSTDFEIDLNFDDLADLSERKSEDQPLLVAEEEKPYVDASVFRQQPSEAIKPKTSFFAKKPVPDGLKHAKDEHDAKKVISTKLEPPMVEETTVGVKDVETTTTAEDAKLAHIVNAIRKIIEVAGRTIVKNLAVEATTVTPDQETTTVTTTTTTTSTENEELPRLSPPIWSHDSEAEALSDPLRLPLVEPYDRYDRYSHSIARDIVW